MAQRNNPDSQIKSNASIENRNIEKWVNGLKLRDLYRIHTDIRYLIFFWIGPSSSTWLNLAFRDVPELSECFDKPALLRRTRTLSVSSIPKTLDVFFPELNELCKALYNEVLSRKASGLDKAEAWLASITSGTHLTSFAELEAAVYLASRGDSDTPDSIEIKREWLSAVSSLISSRKGKIKNLPLREAAAILKRNGDVVPFWSARDEEEDFIAATMLRAAEWLDIPGFDEWWSAATRDLSAGPQFGIELSRDAFWLFHWCRSDMALAEANKTGLDAWLWALSNGLHVPHEPWKIFDGRTKQPRFRDFLNIAAWLLFAKQRILPSQISNEATFENASALLIESQLPCGAWPQFADEMQPCFLTTCHAIHALALAKPRGWRSVLSVGADWLWTQQRPIGCWEISGGPTVMLTVLALDAISLAKGRPVTFGRTALDTNPQSNPQQFGALLDRVKNARTSGEKGHALENLVKALFETVPDFRVRTNVRTATEEIDISIVSGNRDPIFRDEGPIILAECKNWTAKCGKNEFVLFHEKIRNRKKRSKLGFLISWNGFAETITSEMLRGSREEHLIVPLTGIDIKRAVAGGAFLPVLQEAWENAVHL